ncbi:MAG: hypothetical protein QOI15_603 [Pseudonocardiales bacterium]|jgi:hypothetical protein|nr:hypothetical protein [Pseudonocardiales bacterium]
MRAVFGPFLLIGYMVRSLLRTVLERSNAMLAVVPLLLVALTLSFFSTEVWQTIGRLRGLPLVLTALLFVGLAAVFATRKGRPDLDRLATFDGTADVRAALPPRLHAKLGDVVFEAGAAPELRRRERTNLLAISVWSQVVTAAVIGALVFLFFVVLGLLAIDKTALVSWLGSDPQIVGDLVVDGHQYILSTELVRVSAFLGVFTGFYFIVSSSSDARLRADLVNDHEDHVRACLAVRHAHWELSRGAPPG